MSLDSKSRIRGSVIEYMRRRRPLLRSRIRCPTSGFSGTRPGMWRKLKHSGETESQLVSDHDWSYHTGRKWRSSWDVIIESSHHQRSKKSQVGSRGELATVPNDWVIDTSIKCTTPLAVTFLLLLFSGLCLSLRNTIRSGNSMGKWRVLSASLDKISRIQL